MNEVEETLRAINAQIGFHKRQIIALKQARNDIMDKYGITMEEEHEF